MFLKWLYHFTFPSTVYENSSCSASLAFYSFFFYFFFIFKLYITVLVLPNIKMNPPQVYMNTLNLTAKSLS